MGTEVKLGLEGVVVAASLLSRVDGEAGELLIGGVPVDQLAGRFSFADLSARLWDQDVHKVSGALGEARSWFWGERRRWESVVDLANPMDALRAGLSWVPTVEDQLEHYARLTAGMVVVAAAWLHHRNGTAMPAPDPHREHVADGLRLLLGCEDPKVIKALATYMMCVSDHGMNASTFAVRVIASTASDPTSAIVGGIGALKGPLHGGAPGPVLTMLDAIGTPDRAETWIRSELASGRRIMGMGHRVYRVRDPRARAFEDALTSWGVETPRLMLAQAVESAATKVLTEAKPDRPIRANVEFYTAILLDAIGIPRELFSPVFAWGRVVGWCAHDREQRLFGRLIRPRAIYKDPKTFGKS